MKLIGLMLARNEQWIIGVSARVALQWCDELVILDHNSTDDTPTILAGIAKENVGRVHILNSNAADWEEMHDRQATLDKGREVGGTHFAIVDADEILTANRIPLIRGWFQRLKPGAVLDLPMVPLWRSLDEYRDDESVWSHSVITIGFADRRKLKWQSRECGYQHHSRPPGGVRGSCRWVDEEGGVFHLQFANWRRLVAKHAWYKMTEAVRWPARASAKALNVKYGEAIEEAGIKLVRVPQEWWDGCDRGGIALNGIPWHEAACKKMVEQHGGGRFEELELWGVV